MGSLNNLYVSSSFQGLMKLTNSATGLTNSLQTIQAGDGSDSPLQMSLTAINISGSFTVNNLPITGSTSGTAGTSGSSGTAGSSGSSGTAGTSGSSGSSGTSGVNGSSGSSGTSGINGSSGTSGFNGSSGSSGTAGSSGTSGSSGVSGSSGTSGTSGGTGSSGSSGTSGSDGLVGSNGTSGTSGTSGVVDYTGLITTGSISTTQQITGSLILPNTIISGSLITNTINGGLLNLTSEARSTGSQLLLISSSAPVSQSNLLLNGGGQAPNQTGSIVISGSNNIIMNATRNNTLINLGTYGYIGGNNLVATIPTLNTASLVSPSMLNNNFNGPLLLTFTTSSLPLPSIFNNQIIAQTTINHPSGSISLSQNTINSAFQSNAATTPLSANSQYFNNIVGSGGVTLNAASSSLALYFQNIGGGITVQNNYTSSVSTAVNNITVQRNLFAGSGNIITVSGSNSANRRQFNDNTILGIGNRVNSDYSTSTAGHLTSTALLGQDLIVSASHNSTTQGGTVIVGKFNATGSLQESSNDAVFVVGNGVNGASRRNAIHVDNNGNTRLTGSIQISGSLQINGQGVVSGSVVTDRNGLIVTGSGGAQSITGSLNLSNGLNLLNNNLFIATGSIQLNNDGQSSISNPGTGRNVLYVDNIYSNFFFGNVPKGQTGRFSGDTNNFVLSPTFSNFATGSRNLIFATDNSFFTSGSNNIFIGDGQPFGSNVGDSLYIGMNENNNQSIITKRGGGTSFPIQLGFPTQVTGSLLVTGGISGQTIQAQNFQGLGISNFYDSVNITGNTLVSGSLNVTGSLTVGGNLQFNVGAFSSTQTQSGSANVSQSINYNTTDYSQGISYVSGSQLTFANTGVYNIQFSAQLLADTGADDVHIWLKKNGTNVPNSAGRVTLANNEELMAAWNYVVEAAAGDYYELVWEAASGDAILLYEAATGNYPAVPSIITTVTQVR